jgi:hypothetical protein
MPLRPKYPKQKKNSKSIHITVQLLTSKPSFSASSLAASTASAVLTCKLNNHYQLSGSRTINKISLHRQSTKFGTLEYRPSQPHQSTEHLIWLECNLSFICRTNSKSVIWKKYSIRPFPKHYEFLITKRHSTCLGCHQRLH